MTLCVVEKLVKDWLVAVGSDGNGCEGARLAVSLVVVRFGGLGLCGWSVVGVWCGLQNIVVW